MPLDDETSPRNAGSLAELEPAIRTAATRFAISTFGSLALVAAWKMWGHWQLLAMVEALILPPGVAFVIFGAFIHRWEASIPPEEFVREMRAFSPIFFGSILAAMGIGGMITAPHPSIRILFAAMLLGPAFFCFAIGRRLRRRLKQEREDRAVWGHLQDR